MIFLDESQVMCDEPDGWAKGWILSNSDMPVAKRSQQGDSSLITWAGIVNQTIIRPFKVVEEVKLNQ